MNLKYQRILWGIENILQKQFFPQKNSSFTFQKVRNNGFFISKNKGNNSYNFHTNKKIWIAPIFQGDEKDIQGGEKIAFEDEENGEIKQSKGLQNFILGKTQNTQTPIFICDNHNYVLEIWEQVKDKNFSIIHIDQHKDDAKFIGDTQNWRETTRICDYLDFALKMKWISNIHSFTESYEISKKQKYTTEKHILNIDLDFFAPELTIISLQEKIELILFYLPQSEIITLATSPLFIDQEFAREIGKLFWKYL